MTGNTNGKESKMKRFFKKVKKLIVNNWQYKLLAVLTAFIIWLVVPFIYL